LELLSKDSRLNNNSLMGPIPMSLTNISALQVLWVILYLKICTLLYVYPLPTFISFYSPNAGICLITSSQAWFPIMVPFRYSLLSGSYWTLYVFLDWSVLLVKLFLNRLPFCLQFCKQLESMRTCYHAPLSRLSSIFSTSPICPSTSNFCPR